jgi:hypothetical protein
MTIFGKKLSEYVAFQKVVLAIIVVVGLLRLGTSLAGMADSTTRWFSMTVVVLLATIWYGVAVHTHRFGSYRQLLPLLVIQAAVSNAIVIAGILIAAATGKANVFTAPEYGGDSSTLFHVGGHVVFGVGVGSLLGWLLASIVMFVTKKVTGAPKPATTAAA